MKREAQNKTKYENKRAEMCRWTAEWMAECLAGRASIPTDTALYMDLIGSVKTADTP